METRNEMSPTEAAHLKGVTRSAIHKAVTEGRLPARRYTGPGLKRAVWLIRREDLDQWEPVTPRERGRRGAEGLRRKRTEGKE